MQVFNKTDKPVKVNSLGGCGAITVFPGETRTMGNSYMQSATEQGLEVSTVTAVAEPEKKISPVIIEDVVEAIILIMRTGDASKLTVDKQPRAAEIEAIVGYPVGAADRKKAFEIYETEHAGE